MALRGTLTHWKTRMLAKSLGIMPCHALGILEALWHTTAELAPSGNIGRLPNQAIAMEMFYEGDPDELIEALIASKHLDNNPVHRLIVHDWAQHADYNTKRKVDRRNESIIANDGSAHVMTRHKSIPEPVPVPVPEPVPVPVPEPPVATHPITPSMVAQGVLSECLLAGKELLSVLTDVVKAESKLPGYVPGDLRDAMIAAYREYEACADKLTEYAPRAAKFFGEGYWRDKRKWPWKPGAAPSPTINRYWEPEEGYGIQ